MVEEPKALRNCIMMLQSANDFLDRAAISAELAGDKQALREIQRLRRSSSDLITNIDYRISKPGRRLP